jgi:hypothetical protein
MRGLFERLIGSRKAGFVFLNEEFYRGVSRLTEIFASTKAFREQLISVETARSASADHSQPLPNLDET